MKELSEAALQREVIDAAKAGGWSIARFPATNVIRKGSEAIFLPLREQTAGFPDLTLCRDRLIFVELKNSTDDLEPDQVAWRDRLIFAGQEWHLWRPENLSSGLIDSILRGRSLSAGA